MEYGHLSDTIGHTRANFNSGWRESIGISVFYMLFENALQGNAIENMWLCPLGIFLCREWCNEAAHAIPLMREQMSQSMLYRLG